MKFDVSREIALGKVFFFYPPPLENRWLLKTLTNNSSAQNLSMDFKWKKIVKFLVTQLLNPNKSLSARKCYVRYLLGKNAIIGYTETMFLSISFIIKRQRFTRLFSRGSGEGTLRFTSYCATFSTDFEKFLKKFENTNTLYPSIKYSKSHHGIHNAF